MTKTLARPVPHSLAYNPAFDGIRGLAVAAIVCFHFGLSMSDGTSYGVDLFFVLSGFLITSVLLKSYPAVDLLQFYFNRLARLAPALWCLLLAYGLFGFGLLDPGQTISDLVSTATYIANWTRAFAAGTPQYISAMRGHWRSKSSSTCSIRRPCCCS